MADAAAAGPSPTYQRWGPAGTGALAIVGIILLAFLVDEAPKVGGALILALVVFWLVSPRSRLHALLT